MASDEAAEAGAAVVGAGVVATVALEPELLEVAAGAEVVVVVDVPDVLPTVAAVAELPAELPAAAVELPAVAEAPPQAVEIGVSKSVSN
jgi:hypothetical protein